MRKAQYFMLVSRNIFGPVISLLLERIPCGFRVIVLRFDRIGSVRVGVRQSRCFLFELLHFAFESCQVSFSAFVFSLEGLNVVQISSIVIARQGRVLNLDI